MIDAESCKISQMKATFIAFKSYFDKLFVRPTTRPPKAINKRRSENLCAHGLF